MKVVWLCSRTREEEKGLYCPVQMYENEREKLYEDVIRYEKILNREVVDRIEHGFMRAGIFNSGWDDDRPDTLIKELYRCSDEEEVNLLSEERKTPENVEEPLFVTKEMGENETVYDRREYYFTVQTTMYMPVMVTVPDDSTDDDIKKAVLEKLKTWYNVFKLPPYFLKDYVSEGCVTLDQRIAAGELTIYDVDLFQWEWFKYHERPIFGELYETELELLSSRRSPYYNAMDPDWKPEEKEYEEIDDYYLYRSDCDEGYWDDHFNYHESREIDDDYIEDDSFDEY